MRVHLFGVASSPGCTNYGIKYLTDQYESENPLAADFISKNFYVDNGVISLESGTQPSSWGKKLKLRVLKDNYVSTN